MYREVLLTESQRSQIFLVDPQYLIKWSVWKRSFVEHFNMYFYLTVNSSKKGVGFVFITIDCYLM